MIPLSKLKDRREAAKIAAVIEYRTAHPIAATEPRGLWSKRSSVCEDAESGHGGA